MWKRQPACHRSFYTFICTFVYVFIYIGQTKANLTDDDDVDKLLLGIWSHAIMILGQIVAILFVLFRVRIYVINASGFESFKDC